MTEPARFRTVMRGYDPDQVLAAMTELTASLSIAQRAATERTEELTRAREREAALASDLHEARRRVAAAAEIDSHTQGAGGLGTRVTAILELAEEEAAQRRSEGERYAEQRRQSAAAEAARMKAAAVASADSIVQQASDTAAAQRERNAVLELQLRGTIQARDEMRQQLAGVCDLLSELEAELAADGEDVPPSDRLTENTPPASARADERASG